MSIGIAYGKIVRLFDDGGDVSGVQGVLVDLVNAEVAAAEKRIQAAQDKITDDLKSCVRSENPDGCNIRCEMFHCMTLRGIRDSFDGKENHVSL